MGQFEVHDIKEVEVEVKNFAEPNPFRVVTLTLIGGEGKQTVKLFTRVYDWYLAAGTTKVKEEI